MNCRPMKTIALICLTSFAVSLASAQVYPTLNKVNIRSQVTTAASSKMYFYDYTLSNDAANKGNILALEIDISRTKGTVDFDTIGLIFEDSFVQHAFQRAYRALAHQIVPVGFPKAPKFWVGGVSDYLTADISGDTLLITPGQSLGGFTLMSKGLPAIRRCTVRPDFDVDSLYPKYEDTVNTIDEKIDSIRNACNYYGFTVGPGSPPSPFNARSFLDTLTSYITQSRSLGWITSQATADSFAGRVGSAKALLRARDTSGLRKVGNEILAMATRDSGSTLTSEAYALVFFNVGYLLKEMGK